MALSRRARIRLSLGPAFGGFVLAPAIADVVGFAPALGLSGVLAVWGVASFPTD